MYAVGGVLQKVAAFLLKVYRKTLLNIAEKCRVIECSQRLTAKEALLQV